METLARASPRRLSAHGEETRLQRNGGEWGGGGGGVRVYGFRALGFTALGLQGLGLLGLGPDSLNLLHSLLGRERNGHQVVAAEPLREALRQQRHP